jgi:hypothetical protein
MVTSPKMPSPTKETKLLQNIFKAGKHVKLNKAEVSFTIGDGETMLSSNLMEPRITL